MRSWGHGEAFLSVRGVGGRNRKMGAMGIVIVRAYHVIVRNIHVCLLLLCFTNVVFVLLDVIHCVVLGAAYGFPANRNDIRVFLGKAYWIS